MSNLNYDEDLKAFYDIVNLVFTNNVEPELQTLYIKHRENIFKNNNADAELQVIIKSKAVLIKDYFSKNYYNFYLKKYFSDKGIAFLIITQLSIKSRIFFSDLINK